MELGGSHNEMVFGDFDEVSQWVNHMVVRAKERKILTASEAKHLKTIKVKVHSYVDIEPSRVDSVKRKLDYLLKHYSTYYNT